jgi:DNA primase
MDDYADRIDLLDLDNAQVGLNWISATCPWHEDEHPSFGINRESGGFNCYSCGEHGPWEKLLDLLGVLEDQSNPSLFGSRAREFKDFVERGVPVESRIVPVTEVEIPPLLPINGYSPAWQYLKNRGIPDDDIIHFQCCSADRLRRRVVLPSLDEDRRVVYWTARDWSSRAKIKYMTPEGRPVGEMFNLGLIRDEFDYCVVVEGPISAMATGRDATCTYSQSFSQGQVDRLTDLEFSDIIVAYDGERRARELSIELCRQLAARGNQTHLAFLPDRQDPADLGRARMREVIDGAFPFSEMAIAKARMTA